MSTQKTQKTRMRSGIALNILCRAEWRFLCGTFARGEQAGTSSNASVWEPVQWRTQPRDSPPMQKELERRCDQSLNTVTRLPSRVVCSQSCVLRQSWRVTDRMWSRVTRRCGDVALSRWSSMAPGVPKWPSQDERVGGVAVELVVRVGVVKGDLHLEEDARVLSAGRARASTLAERCVVNMSCRRLATFLFSPRAHLAEGSPRCVCTRETKRMSDALSGTEIRWRVSQNCGRFFLGHQKFFLGGGVPRWPVGPLCPR